MYNLGQKTKSYHLSGELFLILSYLSRVLSLSVEVEYVCLVPIKI